MYRRLVTFALLVVTVAATVLVIPLALSARDLVRAGNLTALADQARIVADSWEALARRGPDSGSGSDDSGSGSDDSSDVPRIEPPGEPGQYVLVYPDGSVVGGPVPKGAAGVVASAARGRSASVDTSSAGYAATPAVFSEDERAVVLAVAGDDGMNAGLGARLAALAAVCALLLAGLPGWPRGCWRGGPRGPSASWPRPPTRSRPATCRPARGARGSRRSTTWGTR